MKKWIIPGIGAAAVALIIAAVVLTSGGKRDTGTPAGITGAYLDAMKAGDYAKAYQYAGQEFDKGAYENSAELQKNLMKQTYAQMEYVIGAEEIQDNKATVEVTVCNADYMELLDQAIYETLKAGGDDAYTEQMYLETLKKAEKKEETVLVNYRLEEGKWVFDGSNSLLQAAMLGYLEMPE